MSGIVIEPLRLVYWPVPKCACTAIKIAIARRLGLEFDSPHAAPFEWTTDPITGYRDFAVVRHPAARLFSLWVNKIADGHPIGTEYVDGMDHAVFGRHLDRIRNGMPFGEFAEAVMRIPIDEGDPHWLPQSPQVPASASCLRLEEAGPLLRLVLPVRNASDYRGGHWVRNTCDSWSMIREYYAEDFSRFGYA